MSNVQEGELTSRQSEYDDLKAKLFSTWELNLRASGVKFPSGQQLTMLIYLYKHYQKLVKIADIQSYTMFFHPKTSSQDKQPRHLKYDGWDLRLSGKSNDIDLKGTKIPNGYFLLASVTHPEKTFITKKNKRIAILNAKDFKELCAAFENKCGMCGNKSVHLEQGHMNPLAGLDLSNTIPLCSKCNNWMGDDIEIDADGRLVCLLTSRFLKKTPPDAFNRIYQDMTAKIKNKRGIGKST